MSERSFSRILNKEAKERTEMLNDAIEAMNNYSEDILKKDNALEQYKINEIKYKTNIKELNEYIEIYKTKVEQLESDSLKNEKEILSLRKKILKSDAELLSLKSILGIFVNEYGIDEVKRITKITKEKLKELMEE